MSNTALTHVWTHSKQSSTHLLVMVALADAANNDGVCWWGKSKLSERCRLSETRLNAVIRDLERAGELQVIEGGYDKDLKRNVSNHYLIMGLAEPSAEARPVEEAKPKKRNFTIKSKGHGGNTVDPYTGVTRLTHPPQHGLPPVGNTVEGHGGNTVDPFPILEPTENPQENLTVPATAGNEPAAKAKRKRQKKDKTDSVPRPEFNAMCDAIVAAHKFPEVVWKTDMAGVIRDAARTLCLAGYKPEHIPRIHAYCREKFKDFSPAAMAKHAAVVLDPSAAAPKPQPVVKTTPQQSAQFDAEWEAMQQRLAARKAERSQAS